jgi:PPE-repeat protein
MDFGIYPPEINSGRMYTGPGSGPMLAAAQAWAALADELYTAASSYQLVVADLTSDSWSGPSSASMAAAAAPYVAWLSSTAAQAEDTAARASAAAAAYESAFASTVPPPVIAANRSLLMTLVATNFLGQNTPAIAATEAQYAEMWAQDAVAMYTYAGSSAAATALKPFNSPQQNTDPGGSASQAAAVSQAASTSAGNVQSTISTVPQTVSAAATPAQSEFLDNLSNLLTVLFGPATTAAFFGFVLPSDILSGPADLPIDYIGTISGVGTDDTVSGLNGVVPWPDVGPAPVDAFPAYLQNMPLSPAPEPMTTVGLGQANTIGALSVPRGWTVEAPEVRPMALSSPITNAGNAIAAPLEAGSANTFNQMGLAGMAGQAMTGPPTAEPGKGSGKAATNDRLTARVSGAPKAGDDDVEASAAPRTVVTGVAAAIRDIAKQRDEGRLTEQEYKEQKKRLLEISIKHRPLA